MARAALFFLIRLMILLPVAVTTEQLSHPEGRALAYLAREVPAWSAKHQCYSCHNNGDGARALYQAQRLSYPVPPAALADTTRWLSRPAQWDDNKGDPAFSDKALARLHFAAALGEALDAGLVKDPALLVEAAHLVADQQQADGSWMNDRTGNLGSPVTYGASLATATARRILHTADAKRFNKELGKADRWLRNFHVENVLDASGILLGLVQSGDRSALAQITRCRLLLLRGQSRSGGWGPYLKSPPEPFDTAVAMLALVRYRRDPEIKRALLQGRHFLIATQLRDGSWPATTRPGGGESYAQRLSTTGWATQALLATR